MGTLDVLAQGLRAEEGIVDVGIELSGVVDVDRVRTLCDGLGRRDGRVVEARLEVCPRVQRLERREHQAELEDELLIVRQRARPAETHHGEHLAVGRSHAYASGACVVPRIRQDERLEVVEVGVERAGVALVLQRDLGAHIRIAQPEGILVLRCVPMPRQHLGPRAALAAQARHVRHRVASEWHVQGQVPDGRFLPRTDADAELHVAVELDLAADGHLERRRGPAGVPRCPRPAALNVKGPIRRTLDNGAVRRRDEKTHRARQQFPAGLANAGHLGGEVAGQPAWQAPARQGDLSAQDAEPVALDHNGRKWRHDLILAALGRVEPAEA